eukprot:4121551-Amphidinium_carterae.1
MSCTVDTPDIHPVMQPQQHALTMTSATITNSSTGRTSTAEHTKMVSVSRAAARQEKPYNAIVRASDNIFETQRLTSHGKGASKHV